MRVRDISACAHGQIDMHNIAASLVFDWQSAGLLLALALVIALAVAARRLQIRVRQVTSALNYMSQRLCMFDKTRRMVVWNRRYLQLYKLSADVG